MAGSDERSEGWDDDRPALRIDCINRHCRRAALVSTSGHHCQVWRSARKHEHRSHGGETYTEFVIKYPFDNHGYTDARILAKQYSIVRHALGEIVPEALFVISNANGKPNLFVIARAVNIWFNIANPQNREEAIGLLSEYPLARAQLIRFVEQAKKWRQGPNPRVIDLYGLDNLVMDNQRQIRFIDSYYVFFFEDMLHLLGGEPDKDLQDKITVSLQRLAYLEEVLRLSAGR